MITDPTSFARWREHLTMPLVASLTLGLAPFTPQPHLVEKILWVVQRGGEGMAPLDVFDLVMHGAPWVWLAVAIVKGPPDPEASDGSDADGTVRAG